MVFGRVGVNRTDGMHQRKGSLMTDETRADEEPTGEAAPDRSREAVAGQTGDHEFPKTGEGGDMKSDDESLQRRPDQDLDEIDGDASEGGTPPGQTIRGG
jgi:hypothetical protein